MSFFSDWEYFIGEDFLVEDMATGFLGPVGEDRAFSAQGFLGPKSIGLFRPIFK